MSSVISRPNALPVGPTRFADNSTSIPPPDPRSRTVSPGFSSVRAVGLPHPREASTAFSGKPSVSRAPYKSLVIGSQHRIAGSQQAVAPESVMLLAIAPYLLLISVWVAIVGVLVCATSKIGRAHV